MKNYAVVSILEATFPLQFPFEEWPLHVTLVRNFESDAGDETLLEILTDATRNQKAVTTTGKSRELFCINKNVPVTVLDETTEFTTLQNTLENHLTNHTTPIGPHYTSYRPHITDRPNTNITPGAPVTITSISLVELAENNRIVVGIVKFN